MQNKGVGASAQKTHKKSKEVVVFDSLTNVFRGDTIASHSTKEAMTMTMFGTMNSKHFSCSCAAAVASAHYDVNLDTAPVLAVSICVLPLVRICRSRM